MLPQNAVTEASLTTKIQVWLKTIPVATRIAFITNILIYVLGALFGYPVSTVCMLPAKVSSSQLWRFFTPSFFHLNLLHIGFNMMSLLSLGPPLELQISTSHSLLLFLLIFPLLTNFLNYVVAYATFASGIYPGFFYQCGVGYSGVLFALITINSLRRLGDIAICGIVRVPAWLYPWVLLVGYSLLLPGVSFIGHAAGVLVGLLFVQFEEHILRVLDLCVCCVKPLENYFGEGFIAERQPSSFSSIQSWFRDVAQPEVGTLR